MSEGPELARFVGTSLKPLLDHDTRSASPLIPTLRAFLCDRASKAETARRLHIDRRTLYRRLEQIERLLGCTLDDAETDLTLAIALRGLDLLQSRSSVVRP